MFNFILFSDRVSYDLSEVPSIFLEPHFDLSKRETLFTVFPNIFLTSDTHANDVTANIRVSDKSILEKKVIFKYLKCAMLMAFHVFNFFSFS